MTSSLWDVPYLSSVDTRNAFLDFYRQRGHKVLRSAAVVCENDPSTLFVNSGMMPLKPVFLGHNPEKLVRACNTQKVLRVSGKHNDLDEVGLDDYHHTFFEMLGHWSFGDYFKAQTIRYGWELMTEVYKLPKERLFVTVHLSDDEAYELWLQETDIEPHRVMRFDHENFWEMGPVGPCGSSSEIHFDLGDLGTQKSTFSHKIEGVNGENHRYVELINFVFMASEKLADGSLKALKERHIDTGAGLERLCSVIQGVGSNYETDLFRPLIDHISELTGVKYAGGAAGTAHRVISDHMRAVGFAVADGVRFAPEGRGYVVRRILRRALRYAHSLGVKEPTLHKLIPTLSQVMAPAFPELKELERNIIDAVAHEEERFLATLSSGLNRLEGPLKKIDVGVKQFSNIAVRVEQYTKELSQAAEQSLVGLKDSTQKISHQMEAVKKSFLAASKEITESFEKDSIAAGVEQYTKELGQAAEQSLLGFKGSTQTILSRQMEAMTKSVLAASKEITESFEKDSIAARVEQYTKELGQAAEQSLRGLKDSTQKISRQMEAMTKNMLAPSKEITESFEKDSIAAGVEESAQKIEQYAREITESFEEVMSKSFLAVSKEIAKGFEKQSLEIFQQAREGMQTSSESLQKFQETLAKSLEEIQRVSANQMAELRDYGQKSVLKVIKQIPESMKEIPGSELFVLYDTYGFPLDLSAQIARERGLTVDEPGYVRAMEEQKSRARGAQKFQALSSGSEEEGNKRVFISGVVAEFCGYDTLSLEKVKTLWVERYQEGEEDRFLCSLQQTPFYPTSGGQLGDRGVLENDHLSLEVLMSEYRHQEVVHHCRLLQGSVSSGFKEFESFSVHVDQHVRRETAIHHSATHLLHATLREHLGADVSQRGSYCDHRGLRFDFSFHRALKPEEVFTIEKSVNEKIRCASMVSAVELPLEEAKATGALHLAGESYGDKVRVLTMGGEGEVLSREFCGGTHVRSTGELGFLVITTESAVAAGIRRITALAGQAAYTWFHEQKQELADVYHRLKIPMKTSLHDDHALELGSKQYQKKVLGSVQKIEALLEEIKSLKIKVQKLSVERNAHKIESLLSAAYQSSSGDHQIITENLSEQFSSEQLATFLDQLSDQLSSCAQPCVAVLWHLSQGSDGLQLLILVAVSPLLQSKKGWHAGKLAGYLCSLWDGRGGGRVDRARGGIKNLPAGAVVGVAEKIKQALEQETPPYAHS